MGSNQEIVERERRQGRNAMSMGFPQQSRDSRKRARAIMPRAVILPQQQSRDSRKGDLSGAGYEEVELPAAIKR